MNAGIAVLLCIALTLSMLLAARGRLTGRRLFAIAAAAAAVLLLMAYVMLCVTKARP